ncbi:MAG: phospholipase D family protein [Actinomycetota bacterium]|nr:phospholipase D family protein [Actinomycetota bacterium]
MADLVYHVDRVLGEGLEWVIKNHHNRRLRRIGWERALVPSSPSLWAEGDPPPRPGNAIEVLVDGGEAFPKLVEAMSKARSHVYYAGWMLTLSFQLSRGEYPLIVRDFFAELSEKVDVRILLWAGAPLPPPFSPRRSEVREWVEELTRGTSIKVGLDSKERPLHCHHEKLAVIDDEIAFVNGLDMTTYGGDRYDTSEHAARGTQGWHDVGTRIRGPLVADVVDHFRQRWREVTREELPRPVVPEPAGETELQLIRTVPEKIYNSVPKGDFRILEAYTKALSSARKIVYLENQFLWSPRIIDILAGKLREPPSDDFRIVVVLPARPTTGDDDTRGMLAQIIEADDGAGRFIACALYARSGAKYDSVYVHAKVGIVDDRWLTIGSANLNNHSLFNDSEVNVLTCDGDLAEATRHRLWAEHLEVDVDDVKGDPTEIVDRMWIPIAKQQLARREAGVPLTHRIVELPGVSRRTKRLLGPLQSLLVDG